MCLFAEDNKSIETQEMGEEKEETVQEDTLSSMMPSAPVLEEQALEPPTAAKAVQYPNLREMHQLEEKSRRFMTQQRSALRPFTKVQLKEFYSNPEDVLAEAFEEEFIANELNYAYREHQLYELLKKYSQGRYNIKINSIDLQGFIKAFHTNSSAVWKIENRTLHYRGVCKDNVSIQNYIRYE